MRTSSWMSLSALLFIVVESLGDQPATLVPVILACTGLIIREIERK